MPQTLSFHISPLPKQQTTNIFSKPFFPSLEYENITNIRVICKFHGIKLWDSLLLQQLRRGNQIVLQILCFRVSFLSSRNKEKENRVYVRYLSLSIRLAVHNENIKTRYWMKGKNYDKFW